MKSYPPASEMTSEDLLELCADVGRNPALSYDLAGSREHIEALCKLALGLVQDLSVERECSAPLLPTIAALERSLVEMTEERDDLKVRCQHHTEARTRLGDLASECLDDVTAARGEVAAAERNNRALQQQVAAMTNERDRLAADLDQARNAWQADILLRDAAEGRREDAETTAMLWQTIADRALQDAKRVPAEQLVVDAGLELSRALVVEQRQHAKTRAELAKALRRLEESQQTVAHNDALHSAFSGACEAVTGYSVAEVNLQLDAELAAHPEPGPLHHARDQRDHQEDTTP